MSVLQIALLVCATSLLIITGGLFIILSMHSRRGVGWWVVASSLQVIIYSLGVVFFGAEKTTSSSATFFILQMTSTQMVSIGIFLFIEKGINIRFRFLLLAASISLILLALKVNNHLLAPYIFSIYLSLISIYTAISVFRCDTSPFLIKVAGLFLFLIGLHWLDFPVMSDIEWFTAMGFLLGLILGVGFYLSLATAAMLQFKKTTNDSERKAVRASIHDPLTDLFNRSHLDTLFEKHKNIAQNGKGSFVLLYIDLDGFKGINDTYGHKAGDLILVVIAKRLKRWLSSKGDAVRIGGDELVVINSLRSDAGSDIIFGTSAAQAVLKLLERPIIDGNNVYNISGSIGGCYYNSAFTSVGQMLTKADQLMYRAKEAGGKRVYFEDIPETSTAPLPVRQEMELPKKAGAE